MKKHVLIDLGNTLIYNRKIDLNAGYVYLYHVLNSIPLSIHEFSKYTSTLFKTLYQTRDVDHIEIPFTTFLSILIDRFHVKPTISLDYIEQEFYHRAIVDEPIVEAVDFLSYLKKKHIDIYILSNSMFSSKCLAFTLQQFGILDYVDGVYSSADIGYRKPSHLFFDGIKDLKNLSKKETIMIGNDFYFDFEFAKAIQVDFLWYNELNLKKDSDTFFYMTKSYKNLINEWSEKFD